MNLVKFQIEIFIKFSFKKSTIITYTVLREFQTKFQKFSMRPMQDQRIQAVTKRMAQLPDKSTPFIGLFLLFLSTYTIQTGARKPIMVNRFQAGTELQTILY